MTSEIKRLKAQFRAAVLTYRNTIGGADRLDCGANLTAVIRPVVGIAAQEANALAAKLKAIDPDFPPSWVPYPEGR